MALERTTSLRLLFVHTLEPAACLTALAQETSNIRGNIEEFWANFAICLSLFPVWSRCQNSIFNEKKSDYNWFDSNMGKYVSPSFVDFIGKLHTHRTPCMASISNTFVEHAWARQRVYISLFRNVAHFQVCIVLKLHAMHGHWQYIRHTGFVRIIGLSFSGLWKHILVGVGWYLCDSGLFLFSFVRCDVLSLSLSFWCGCIYGIEFQLGNIFFLILFIGDCMADWLKFGSG